MLSKFFHTAKLNNSVPIFPLMIFNQNKQAILFAFLAISTQLYSVSAQSWDDDEVYVSRRQGLEFGINMGVYLANNNPVTTSANFYNGDGYYDLGDNSATLFSIEERLMINAQTISNVQNIVGTESFEIPDDSYSYAMRYDPGMMLGFKTVYFWNPESALILGLDAMSLKASGAWTLHAAGLPGQGQGTDNIKLYGVFGQERRMIATLGFRTSAYIIDQAAWIFELGGTATGVQINRNFVMVETTPYELITMYSGPGQFSGATSNLTSVGLGFYGTIGLEALFEEGGNLEANLRISRDNIHLGSKEPDDTSFEQKSWNVALYVTWMIPPHIGDFVRATF
jgi:hypothetical protein|tara:strand:+ start:727 stop:1743 length:1017 start_codon:yes stop_codon:yes gene_type:complete